jgi:hypothetical protein
MNPIAGFLMGGPVGAAGAAGSFGAASAAISQLGSLSSAASMQADSILGSLQGTLAAASPGQGAAAAPADPSGGVSAAGIESLLRGGLAWLTNLFGGAEGGLAGDLAGEATQLALPLAI